MADESWTLADAEEAVAAGDLERALEICEQLVAEDAEDLDALRMLGELMLDLDEFEAAEEIFRDAQALLPEHGPLYEGHGVALFELCRFDEAHEALSTALDLDPRLAEARMVLGYIHERWGDVDQAQQLFQRAVEHDPERFHLPVPLSDAQLEHAARQAVQRFPPAIRRYLDHLPWRIEALPQTRLLERSLPPVSPLVLCLIIGEPRSREETPQPLSAAADEVLLFRSNLEKAIQGEEELPDLLQRALLLDLGHFLDLEPRELNALGLERMWQEIHGAPPPEPADEELNAPPLPPRTLH